MAGWAWLAAVPALAIPLAGARQGVLDDDPQRDGRTIAGPSDALDDGVLRSVCLDLYGRPPFGREIETWLGRSLREFLEEALGSREFWDAWFQEQLYYFLLIDNFRPESERARAVPEALSERRLDVRDAVHRIALSPSFELRNPGADTFVTVVLEQLTGMKVQSNVRELEIGKRIYDGGAGIFLGEQGGSQADVVRIAIESKAFATHFLEREYARIVHREPSRKELNSWARDFRKDPGEYVEIVRDWIRSDVYRERLAEKTFLPNRFFVSTLFVDLLDRLPTDEERETLRSALDGLSDSGPLRSILARLLLDSGQVPLPVKDGIADPAAWITGRFRRLLGRPPTEAELTAFTAAFEDPDCEPATVIYAIVSHPEYHLY